MSLENINNHEKIEYFELKSESRVISYEDYALVCNCENTGSRSRGILSAELYQEIINDPDTKFISFGSQEIPVLIGTKYSLSMGYDTDKCIEYAESVSDNIKLLSLPVQELDLDQQMQFVDIIKNEGDFALYFSDHDNDEISFLKDIFTNNNIRFDDRPLVDPRVKVEADKQASLCLYSTSINQVNSSNNLNEANVQDAYSFYDKNKELLDKNDAKSITRVIMGNCLSDSQAEEYWTVYDDKFNFLGENHPISMQDTKEDFFGLLRSENTLIASTYLKSEDEEDESLACFTYFTDDIDSLYWLNKKYLNNSFSTHFKSNVGTVNVFTPGLVSSAKGSSYSLRPLGLVSELCDKAGLNVNILFENTNLSKQVVPWLVNKAMASSCKIGSPTKSVMLDSVSYNLWSVKP